MQTGLKTGRRRNDACIPRGDEATPNAQILPSARNAPCRMLSHGHGPVGRERAIYIIEMLFAEGSAVHRVGTSRLRYPFMRTVVRPPIAAPDPDGLTCLPKCRFDDLGKRVSRPVEPRLHGPKVAMRNLGDLLIRPALELTQHEHFPVMRRKLCH